MLSKKYRLSKRNFEIAFKKKGHFLKTKLLKVKVVKNDLEISRFGASCSLKISKKATVRNKIKRQLNDILRHNLDDIKVGYDIIIMPTPEIINQSYQNIQKELLGLFKENNLISVTK